VVEGSLTANPASVASGRSSGAQGQGVDHPDGVSVNSSSENTRFQCCKNGFTASFLAGCTSNQPPIRIPNQLAPF